MSVQTESLVHRVLTCDDPDDLFPADDEDARREYRRLARLLHPDVAGHDAADAFRHLSDLYEWHRTGRRPKGARQIILTTRRRSYVLGNLAYEGDVANLYRGSYDNAGTPSQVLLKMPRDPANNDFLQAESEALKLIGQDVDPKWHPFFSELVETFRHEDRASGERRRVNAIKPLEGFYSLAQVRKAYPDGLHPKDVAWMWRRILVGLGVTHDAGLVHGAPIPENILIHPKKHGVVLVGWCYSVKNGEPLRAVPSDRSAYYPEMDIADRIPASGAVDMFVAHRTIHGLLKADDTPKQFYTFLSGVMQIKPGARPDAGETLEALDDLLFRLYGPRRYRPFEMPAV